MASIDPYILDVLREHGEMYGFLLMQYVSQRVNQDVAIGEIYTACDRLEEAGAIVSRDGEATAERGWRKKRYFKAAS